MYIIMEKTQLILYISCRSIEYIYIKKAWTLSHIKKLLTVVHGLHTYKQIYIHTYIHTKNNQQLRRTLVADSSSGQQSLATSGSGEE